MALKSKTYQFKGMNRDLSNMNASDQFAYEIRNMRITADKTNTTLSLNSVPGSNKTNLNLQGTPIGHAIIDNEWIIFCAGELGVSSITDIGIEEIYNYNNINTIETEVRNIIPPTDDYIYRFTKENNELKQTGYVSGNLDFSIEHPIETTTFVENDQLKKVYWTDNKNQLRFIRLDRINYQPITSSEVDFIPEVKSSNETVTITKNINTIGMFPAGTTQYAFSYINYYGQQSNLFYISSIYYNVSNDKALEVNKTSSDSYTIIIQNLNNNDYQYVRIYSIVRTSQDSTPEVRIVADYKLKDSTLEYTDRHTTGYIIDPTELFYIGGEQLVVGTITQKDNTLFIGDITQKKEVLPENIVKQFRNNSDIIVSFYLDNNKNVVENAGGFYYTKAFEIKDKSSNIVTTFKMRDYYRFGVQLMHKSGRWSEPIYIKDLQNNVLLNSKINSSNTSHTHTLISAKIDINDQDLLNSIQQLGYIKVRPLIVYPELQDRVTLCQGYLSPTVYNIQERVNNGAWVQSSWFARPSLTSKDFWADKEYEDGAILEYRHNKQIAGMYTSHNEIQSSNSQDSNSIGPVIEKNKDITSWVNFNSAQFFVDASIVTMHSPEIEFNESIKTLDLNNYKFRIVGTVPLTSFQGDIDVITKTGPKGLYDDGTGFSVLTGSAGYDYTGFYKKLTSKANYSKLGNRILCSGVFYRDAYNYTSDDYRFTIYKTNSDFTKYLLSSVFISNKYTSIMGYHIHPFQASGSISGGLDKDGNELGNKYNELQYKKLSNVRYSYGTNYFKDSDIENINTYSKQIFTSESSTPLKIKNYKNEDVNYYGNVDTIILGKYLNTDNNISIGVNRYEYPQIAINSDTKDYFTLNVQESQKLPPITSQGHINSNPIQMRYKSTPHVVVTMCSSYPEHQYVLPKLNSNVDFKNWWLLTEDTLDNYKFIWDVEGKLYKLNYKDYNIYNYNSLFLAEIYQDIKDTSILFGGTSTQAISNNKWNVAGESVSLNSINITLNCTEGDTYYQRYDNLKTYPWSMEEVNGITDVISFMVETRINLEGRYDSNKADKPHFHILPSNFNLINKVYTQKNNFFEYYGIDYDRVEVNKYPNLISWSKTKTSGELVDTWLNLNLSSTLELDGNNGKINSLQNYNGTLLAFQNKSLSQILFNEQMQISTQQGVPIEIANSGKVTGNRIISNQLGCSNKWSICSTPNGLYFLDSYNKDIIRYGEGLTNLTANNGFTTYLRNINNIEKPWNAHDYYSIKTSYDSINKEVLFSVNNNGKQETLSYSEWLQTFMSFYDYKTDYFVSLQGDSYLLGKSTGCWDPDNTLKINTPIYEYQKHYYNFQYGNRVPYYIEFIANPDPLNDKVFNAIEFRSDSYDYDNTYRPNDTFNKLTISNEYQSTQTNLYYNKYGLSNLKKKFRVWKTQIPRDNTYKQDRIRNPWIKIKLEKDDNYPVLNTILHDITVHYSI